MVLEVVVPDDSTEAVILRGKPNPQEYLLVLVRADRMNQVPVTPEGIPDYLAILQGS